MTIVCEMLPVHGMIVLHVSLPIDPSRRDEAIDLISHLVEQSNREPGAIDYRAAVDITDENTIRIFEQYEDEDALESHTNTDHYQEFEEQISGLLAGEPDAVEFAVGEARELDL